MGSHKAKPCLCNVHIFFANQLISEDTAQMLPARVANGVIKERRNLLWIITNAYLISDASPL
jgi:hypothetical protein